MIEAKAAKRRVFKPKLETKVRREEFQKVSALAALEGKTKSEVVRDAVLFYLAAKEDEGYQARESALAKEIEAMANRVCAMLARQGRQVGTIFELTYSQMSRTADGKASFESAATTASQKMARSVQKDERDLVEAMKKAAKP